MFSENVINCSGLNWRKRWMVLVQASLDTKLCILHYFSDKTKSNSYYYTSFSPLPQCPPGPSRQLLLHWLVQPQLLWRPRPPGAGDLCLLSV